jgi:hypothetical protein
VITAVAAGLVSVITALRGERTAGKADVLSSRADSLAEHARSLDSQLTQVALSVTPPGTPSAPPSAPPPDGVTTAGFPIAGWNLDRPKGQ